MQQTQILTFPKPIWVIDDFLPEEKAEEVLQECIDLRPIYQPAKVLNDSGSAERPGFRENDVVYVNPVFAGNEGGSKILSALLNNGSATYREPPACGLWSPEARKLWSAGSSIFDVINLSTRSEVILSRYGNCDFYGWHTDPNANPANRIVTVVYYANRRPEKFIGGAIEFREGEQSIVVEPKHNRVVIFQANILHQVQKVRIEGDAFENGRFSLNIWLGFNG